MEILIPIFAILVVLVPVTGITVILTLNLGGKPFIAALAKELRGSGLIGPGVGHEDARVADLMEQVEVLSSEVHRLQEAQDFDRQLAVSADPHSRGSRDA